MKKPIFLLLAIVLAVSSMAQVEPINSIQVPKKIDKNILGADKSEIFLSAYNVKFFVQTQGNLDVTTRLRLEIDFTEEDIQAITSEAAAYLKSELEKVGIKLNSYDKNCINDNKYTQKIMSKNPGAINWVNGNVDFQQPKDINYWKYFVSPEGFDIMYYGGDLTLGGALAAGRMACQPGRMDLFVDLEIYFANWESGFTKYGRESLTANYDLKLQSIGTQFNLIDPKLKMVMWNQGAYRYASNDWVASEEKNGDVIKVKLAREKYKTACLALLKKHADEMVAVIKASNG